VFQEPVQVPQSCTEGKAQLRVMWSLSKI